MKKNKNKKTPLAFLSFFLSDRWCLKWRTIRHQRQWPLTSTLPSFTAYTRGTLLPKGVVRLLINKYNKRRKENVYKGFFFKKRKKIELRIDEKTPLAPVKRILLATALYIRSPSIQIGIKRSKIQLIPPFSFYNGFESCVQAFMIVNHTRWTFHLYQRE